MASWLKCSWCAGASKRVGKVGLMLIGDRVVEAGFRDMRRNLVAAVLASTVLVLSPSAAIGARPSGEDGSRLVETPLLQIDDGEIFVVAPQKHSGECRVTTFAIYWEIPTDRVITDKRI